jgi:hypothetical protein
MTPEELTDALSENSMERLRWLVLREFSVLPSSRAARRMSDADCLRFACHMLLDRRAGAGAGEEYNPAFDPDRFIKLKEAGR